MADRLREPRDEQLAAQAEPPEDDGVHDGDRIAAAREVRLFMARVAEAVESATEMLRADIAAEIVGRELQLAPADLRSIVERTVRRYVLETPVRVRVHPDDLGAFDGTVPAVADAQLRRGDAVLELRTGTIDASLGARLDAVLRACP
ncbi:MAG TPA: FliH/SctL family protein [Candidatus Rubrimentiphilum sp.]|nr:FliH/SctL family protein [Candidatus Rubrimentiphilum sp.]